eukprot:scaffold63725_cov30-Phaeocystis_antarctica.AAC.1
MGRGRGRPRGGEGGGALARRDEREGVEEVAQQHEQLARQRLGQLQRHTTAHLAAAVLTQ